MSAKATRISERPIHVTKIRDMKLIASLLFLLSAAVAGAQEDTMLNALTRDMGTTKEEPKPVQIFSSERAIHANTTELVGKGRMQFLVTHNFDDIAGSRGGIKNFFGLDVTTDVRIGFEIGLGRKLDAIVSRAKAAGNISRIFELGFKYRFLQQTEDNSTPLSLALFVNNALSTMDASPVPTDENYFREFSDRNSQVVQLIVARRFGRVSLQLNPTFLHQGYVIPNDQQNIFALGGVIRFPVGRSVNLIVDYFHPFRNEQSKDSLFSMKGLKFYDPLGLGVEILTAGHVFLLKFSNAREILENRFIPRTTTNWGDGQFRWCFTISRRFVLWRERGE